VQDRFFVLTKGCEIERIQEVNQQ